MRVASRCFPVLEGDLTLRLDGQTSVLRQGETGVMEPCVWHDWSDATGTATRGRASRLRPIERFAHLIEAIFGRTRLEHTNAKGMPHPLRLALTAREFGE
jgi:hypothetical protein